MERGHDLLQQHPNFELVEREKELARLIEALTRKNANSVLLVGPGGVGCTALCMGLQASKEDPDASYDIISKRFYWLDTDGLFESGDPDLINQSFQKTLKTLSRYGNSVMIVDDMRDFVDGMRNTGCNNLINALMRAIRQNKVSGDYRGRRRRLGCGVALPLQHEGRVHAARYRAAGRARRSNGLSSRRRKVCRITTRSRSLRKRLKPLSNSRTSTACGTWGSAGRSRRAPWPFSIGRSRHTG